MVTLTLLKRTYIYIINRIHENQTRILFFLIITTKFNTNPMNGINTKKHMTIERTKNDTLSHYSKLNYNTLDGSHLI